MQCTILDNYYRPSCKKSARYLSYCACISWPHSEIFGPDMFGSAFGKEENGFQISDGWFANISTIYDPKNEEFEGWIDTNHNPYGFVTASYNFQVRTKVLSCFCWCFRGLVRLAKVEWRIYLWPLLVRVSWCLMKNRLSITNKQLNIRQII